MTKMNIIKFWVFISVSILLSLFLIVGQTYSMINYDLIVSFGLQESAKEISEVGVAWAKAFALGDTVVYIPLLILGIIGLLKRKSWGFFTMFASLAISVYWPVVNLSAIYIGRDEIALNPEKYISFSIILPLVTLYGLWGMWYLYKNEQLLVKK